LLALSGAGRHPCRPAGYPHCGWPRRGDSVTVARIDQACHRAVCVIKFDHNPGRRKRIDQTRRPLPLVANIVTGALPPATFVLSIPTPTAGPFNHAPFVSRNAQLAADERIQLHSHVLDGPGATKILLESVIDSPLDVRVGSLTADGYGDVVEVLWRRSRAGSTRLSAPVTLGRPGNMAIMTRPAGGARGRPFLS
jgi:hypothetical protein